MKNKIRELLIALYGKPTSKKQKTDLDDAIDCILILCDVGVRKSLEEREEDFMRSIVPYLDTYGENMCKAFANHWLERSPEGKKFRFEFQKTWNINLRLKTWAKRSKNYKIVNMLRQKTNGA